MRTSASSFFTFVAAGCLLCSGCVSKRKAAFAAQQAYVAGQQQEMRQDQARQPQLVVRIQGEVTNPVIPWTPDLTLIKTIVAANYTGVLDPRFIRIVRNGETAEFKPFDLQRGHDVPVEAGDLVQIMQ